MVQKCVTITEDDCIKVLEKYFNQEKVPKILHFSITPVSEDVNGFMSEHLFLKIRIDNDSKTELRFFAKTLLEGQDVQTEFVKAGNMFNKEVLCYQFFEDVKKECPTFDVSFAPKYYFSREDEVIILQDMTEADCQMWDGPLELDLEHIKLSLKSTAKMHAASFIFEEIKSKKLGRPYRLMEDYAEGLVESLYVNNEDYLGFKYMNTGMRGLFALKELMPESALSVQEFKTKVSALHRQVFDDLKPSKKFRNVWCHGDLWTKNVMFRYKNDIPVNCILFDFQLQRYNPPAHDVLFMIYQTADKKTQQEYFDYLVDYYYDSLKSELEKVGFEVEDILSRDEYDNSIKTLYPSIKLQKAIYKTLTAVSQKSLKTITSNPELYAKITFCDRSEFVTNEFKSYKPYRDFMTHLFEDVEDILIHNKITKEDCYTILRHKLGTAEYELLQYETVPFTDEKTITDNNQMKLKIKICQKDCVIKELNFLVKSFPEETAQDEANDWLNRFFKEMKFYTKIIPKMVGSNVTPVKECVLDCFLARLNDVIVFEDYSSQDYAICNSTTSLEYEMVAAVIRKLAKLHASALIFEEKLNKRLGDLYKKELCENDNVTSIKKQNLLNMIIAVIDSLPDATKDISPELLKKRATNAIYKIHEHMKPSQKYRNTTCHGYLCPNNILFKFKNDLPADCMFINFETVNYSPPAYDVMNFLRCCTNRKFRAQHTSEMLNLYHSEISTIFKNYNLNIIKVLSLKEFLKSCEEFQEFSVVQSLVHSLKFILTLKGFKHSCSDDIINKDRFLEDLQLFMAGTCAKEVFHKKKLHEAIIDLQELCEH